MCSWCEKFSGTTGQSRPRVDFHAIRAELALADVKCPRSVDFEAELPRHPTGKLYKRILRDRYWEGRASKLV